ncbi:MAG TPA: hypothetical protein VD968_06480 [Pyrinomonadaceae bacterium]|nr:hypothetical protein [Pyrinomonadaceae bacterium]
MKTKIMLYATLAVLALAAAAPSVSAQSGAVRARTEGGREVILYPDGTWKYASDVRPPAPAGGGISVVAPVVKADPSKTLFKTERGSFGIRYDPSKWQPARRPAGGEPGQQSFNLVRGDGYAVMITEELPIPTNTLRNIALENARAAAPDARIVFEERRTVNGREVLCMKIEGTIQQIPFIYYGYYYGGKAGTIQMLTYTGQSLFAKYEADFTEFLNGLEIYEQETPPAKP